MGRADARRAQQRGARRAAKSGGIRRLFTWRKMLGTFFGFCLLIMGAFVALYLYVDIPKANALAERQSNVYQYSDGTVLTRTGDGVNRQIVDLAEVPKEVQHTFVAAENKTFYKDQGVDLKGTARGILNTLSGKGKQGGSTITQQYVKNYYLTQDPTVSRKLKELVISLKVDQKKDKNYILAGYINTAYYGRGASGSRPRRRPTTGWTPRTSMCPRVLIWPRCSRPPASTTGRSRRPPAGGSSRSAGPTRSTTWSRCTGSTRPSATP